MARNSKYEKNLAKVQSYLDGTHQEKIQSGYTPTEEQHEIGDKWFDSEGVQWEQKNGYRSKVSKVNVGMFSKQCKDCDKPCTKSFDVDTYNRMGRCFYCQMNFEVDLKNKGKWEEWVKEQEISRWETIIKEVAEIDKKNLENKWDDKSIVNSMANANVEMTIKKNTK